MLVVLNLCMVLGLVGDNCKDESAEECDAEAGGQHDVARRKGGFEFGFGFVVHGIGFSGWKKRMCVGEPHPSVGYLNLTTVLISAGLTLNCSIRACLNSSASSLKSKVTELTDSCFPCEVKYFWNAL